MRLGEGVEWALHSCTLLASLPDGTRLPAARLAEYHGVPAAYLAKHLQRLAQAGIVAADQGPRGGYRLARPAEEITLLDVVEAVEGDEPAFRCAEIRLRSPVWRPRGKPRSPCTIAAAMAAAEAAWRRELRARTIADVVASLERKLPRRQREATERWALAGRAPKTRSDEGGTG